MNSDFGDLRPHNSSSDQFARRYTAVTTAQCTKNFDALRLRPHNSSSHQFAKRHCRQKSTEHQELRRLKPPSSELHSDLRTETRQYNNNIYTQISSFTSSSQQYTISIELRFIESLTTEKSNNEHIQ